MTVVKVVKEKKGAPTVIEWQGRTYILQQIVNKQKKAGSDHGRTTA